MPDDKIIKIRCKANENVPIELFNPLQGNLKDWVDDNYQKLEESLIKYGFCVPMFAWKDKKGKIWTLDGHGRDIILKDMINEGWSIPPLPTCWILAKSKKEAAEILLLINSRMREITEEGIEGFATRFKIDLEAISDFTDFPEIDIQSIIENINGIEIGDMTFKNNEKELDENIETEHECPDCGYKW